MFLRLCSPRSSNVRSSLPAASSWTKPGCDIHTVTEDVRILDDDIALVNTDTELDAAGRRHIGVTLGHAALPFGRTTQPVDDARKFDQQAITGSLHDAAPVFGDLRVDNVRPDRL